MSELFFFISDNLETLVVSSNTINYSISQEINKINSLGYANLTKCEKESVYSYEVNTSFIQTSRLNYNNLGSASISSTIQYYSVIGMNKDNIFPWSTLITATKGYTVLGYGSSTVLAGNSLAYSNLVGFSQTFSIRYSSLTVVSTDGIIVYEADGEDEILSSIGWKLSSRNTSWSVYPRTVQWVRPNETNGYVVKERNSSWIIPMRNSSWALPSRDIEG